MEQKNKRSFKFGANARITRDKEIELILNSGNDVHQDFLTLASRFRSPEPGKEILPRMAIRISAKGTLAVQRNRVKRILREIFRHERWNLKQEADIVVLVRPAKNWEKAGFPEWKHLFLQLCQKGRILKDPC